MFYFIIMNDTVDQNLISLKFVSFKLFYLLSHLVSHFKKMICSKLWEEMEMQIVIELCSFLQRTDSCLEISSMGNMLFTDLSALR